MMIVSESLGQTDNLEDFQIQSQKHGQKTKHHWSSFMPLERVN